MPSATNTAWNETLVLAMEARADKCDQEGSRSAFNWRKAAKKLQEVRGDIYQCSDDGHIFGLPEGLGNRAEEECRAIIEGRSNVLPAGHVPRDSRERQIFAASAVVDGRSNPVDGDPYLNHVMKERGGAYAIMMAFHHSNKKSMTLEEICDAAQPYCDSEMRSDFRTGRQYGAWSGGKDALVDHRLLSERRGTWTLTENGKQFIQAMIRRFPGIRTQQQQPAEAVSSSFPLRVSPLRAPSQPRGQSSFLPDENRRKELMARDEQNLFAWISSAGRLSQKEFIAGGYRRERLDEICGELERQNPGLKLRRKVCGERRGRALYVTVESVATGPIVFPTARDAGGLAVASADDVASAITESEMLQQAIRESKKMSERRKREADTNNSDSFSRVCEGKPTKRSRTAVTAEEENDQTAWLQQAIEESVATGMKKKPEKASKNASPSAAFGPGTRPASAPQHIDLSGPDDTGNVYRKPAARTIFLDCFDDASGNAGAGSKSLRRRQKNGNARLLKNGEGSEVIDLDNCCQDGVTTVFRNQSKPAANSSQELVVIDLVDAPKKGEAPQSTGKSNVDKDEPNSADALQKVAKSDDVGAMERASKAETDFEVDSSTDCLCNHGNDSGSGVKDEHVVDITESQESQESEMVTENMLADADEQPFIANPDDKEKRDGAANTTVLLKASEASLESPQPSEDNLHEDEAIDLTESQESQDDTMMIEFEQQGNSSSEENAGGDDDAIDTTELQESQDSVLLLDTIPPKVSETSMESSRPSNDEDEAFDIAESQELQNDGTALENIQEKMSTTRGDEDDNAIAAAETQESQDSVMILDNLAEASPPSLTIFIDHRERNANATPRKLRMELTRHMTSGPVKDVWPARLPIAEVVERKLKSGDFAFEISSGKEQRQRLSLCVERKRVNDLVQRSAYGDHWRQLQRMRDHFRHVFILIEGDTKITGKFTPFGYQYKEGWNPGRYIVGDESGYYHFVGRAVLSSRAIKFIHTKDEQASHRAIGTLGLMAVHLEGLVEETEMEIIPMTTERQRLSDRIRHDDLPYEVACRVAEEFGSCKQIQSVFRVCCVEARALLLCPVIENVFQELKYSPSCTIKEASQLIYEQLQAQSADELVGVSVSSDPARRVMGSSRMPLLVDDPGPDQWKPRKVWIQTPVEFASCFPNDDKPSSESKFYNLDTCTENPFGIEIPTLVMQTRAGKFTSTHLFVHVLEAKKLLSMVEDKLRAQTTDYVDMARSISRELRASCHNRTIRSGKDRQILVIRGLLPGIDAAAKRPGYRSELRVLVDLIFASLMLEHDLVVLQLVRKTNHLDVILRQLALACFHYQLLTEVFDNSSGT